MSSGRCGLWAPRPRAAAQSASLARVSSPLAPELAIASRLYPYCSGLRPWPWSVTPAQPRGAAQYQEPDR